MPIPAFAQENDGGILVTLGFSQNLRNDNDGLQTTSDIDFSFSSVTRSQRFELDLGGNFEAALDGDQSAGFDNPFANLLYSYDAANAAFETQLRYSLRDIEESVIESELEDTGVLIDEGQQEDTSAALRFEWGQGSLFGGSIDASYNARRFRDLENSNLLDRTNVNLGLRLNFEVDPQFTAFTSLSYRDTDRDGGRDSEALNLAVGGDFALSQSLTGSLSIGQSRTRESGVGAGPDQSGLSLNGSLVQEMPNGSLSGTLSSRLGENGRQSTLRISRALDLRDGSFEAGFGYGEVDGKGNTLFTLGYARQGLRNSISFRFDQSFSGSNDGSAVLNSSLSANYQQDLTERANFSIGVAYRNTDPVETGTDGTEQFSVNFSYNHALTERWFLTGGISHIKRRSDSGAETSDDTIFVGLRTVLSWRP